MSYSSVAVGAGLNNLGNTCFLNSVLQALSHSDYIVHSIANSDHRKYCRAEASGGLCVLCAFESHINMVRKAPSPLSPTQFVKCLPMISSTIQVGEQEDAHEFLRCLVDAMQRSILNEKVSKGTTRDEYPFSLFKGSVQNVVQCLQCKKTSYRTDPVEDLELEIDRATSLDAALGFFTSIETMTGDNKYACEKCDTKTEVGRRPIPPLNST